MYSQILMHIPFLCLWCLLIHYRGMIVAANPKVTAWIVEPEAGRKEGGRIEMVCAGKNLEADHTLEWRTPLNSPLDDRYTFNSRRDSSGQPVQEISICDLQRKDTGEYVCNARNGSSILATFKVNLTVLYFPNESFPICFPDGPVTVDSETELRMQCSIKGHSPAFTMEVFQLPRQTDAIPWMDSSVDGRLSMSYNMTPVRNDTTFACIISPRPSFGVVSRSCIIGPISVSMTSDLETVTSPTAPSPTTITFPIPWTAACAALLCLLVASCIALIVLIRRGSKQKRHIRNLTSRKSQLEYDLGELLESPIRESILVRLHTYMNSIRSENEYGERQGGSTIRDRTAYEDVDVHEEEQA